MDKNTAAILRVPAERKQLSAVRDFIAAQAEAAGLNRSVIDDLVQAVDEAATNIIVHGYQDGPGQIEIEFRFDGRKVEIILRDKAPTFDPRQVPPVNIHLPLHKRRAGGLGVHLMRQCVDEMIHHVPLGGGNELVMIKRVEPPQSDD